MKSENLKLKPGQALVTLLVFVAMATVIISGAVAVTIISSQSTSKFATSEEALAVAEAGADNAMLKILRDPQGNYSGETLSVGNGNSTISIDRSSPPTIIITSVGEVSEFIRTIEVEGEYQDNIFTTTRYEETD